jgi:hypothetical protein
MRIISAEALHGSCGLLFLCGAVLLFSGCSKHQYLTGYYDRAQFVEAVSWSKKVDMGYRPDAGAMAQLAKADSFEIRMYMATWCHDSKKWVPRLLAMSSRIPLRKLELIPVDTTKQDPKGWAKRDGLKSTPTTIVLRKGVEVGRIVETPMRSGRPVRYEEALADIAAARVR